jgi:hypothetical protein
MPAFGHGIAAGFAGTVALTASQRIEMAITGRPSSDLPARVAEGVLGISPRGRRRALVATAAHWLNNTSSGTSRALIGTIGLRGAPAVGATFVLYLGGEALLFRELELPRPRPVDLLHAGVWAVATNAVYERLQASSASA